MFWWTGFFCGRRMVGGQRKAHHRTNFMHHNVFVAGPVEFVHEIAHLVGVRDAGLARQRARQAAGPR